MDTTDLAAAGGIFQRLGDVVVRRPLVVIGFWIALVAVLTLTLPPLALVAARHQPEALPADAPVVVTGKQMAEAFHEKGSGSVLLVVLANEQGLGPADEQTYRTLVDNLRKDTKDVQTVQDFLGIPQLREVLQSKDNKVWALPVVLNGDAGTPQAGLSYKHASEIVKKTAANSTLTANLTGPAATTADLVDIGEKDLHLIEAGTTIMVLLILLIVYRNPVTMLIPLITIGVAVATAQGVLAGLGELGLGITGETIVFMTGVIFGAGTDYGVFLISRYHDYVRLGADSDQAMKRALASIGKVIAASAATVAVTFLAMIFSKLELFATVGPAISICVIVAFLAAVSFLPALLVLAGRRGWIRPRSDLTHRFWRRSGIRIVRRPKTHLVASLIVLAILASCVSLARYNYDDRKSLPGSVESAVGFAALDRHLPLNSILPQYLFIQSPHDLRTPEALADLEQMARRVAQVPDVAMVRGITRPLGESLEQTKATWQAGVVGDKLDDASKQIADHDGDLNRLTGGADQLADALGDVRNQVSQSIGNVRALVNALTSVQNQIGGEKTLRDIDNAANLITSMRALGVGLADIIDAARGLSPAVTVLDASPICNADPACINSRDQLRRLVAASDAGTLDKMSDLVRQLQSAQETQTLQSTADGLRRALATANAAISGAPGQLASLQDGSDKLADGSRQLADGVQQLVDQTKRIGAGLGDASAFLLGMKHGAGKPSMAGFYIPPQVLTQNEFKTAADIFMSPDGHATRFFIQTKLNPFSIAAMDQINSITNAARSAQPNTVLADAKVSMAGMTVGLRDTRDYYNQDTEFIVVATIIIVLLILMALLRAIVAPLYLILSVLISYASALGIGVIVFQFLLGQELHWSAPGLTFILLVAVGADYNLLLISRIRDESPHGVRSGVIRTVGSTGGVITSAGLIFAASMFGLTLASISTMVQIGSIIGIGILLDTFLVRTITVPAMAALVGRANWWPSRFGRQAHTRVRQQVHAPVRRAEQVQQRVSEPLAAPHRAKNDIPTRRVHGRVAMPPSVADRHRHGRHEADEEVPRHALPLFGRHTVPKQPTTDPLESRPVDADGLPTQPIMDVAETPPVAGNGQPKPPTADVVKTPSIVGNGMPKPFTTNGLDTRSVGGNGLQRPGITNGSQTAPVNGNGLPKAPATNESELLVGHENGAPPPTTNELKTPALAGNDHPTPSNTNDSKPSSAWRNRHPKQLASNVSNTAVVSGNGQRTLPSTDMPEAADDGPLSANGEDPTETYGEDPAETGGEDAIETNGQHPAQTNGHEPVKTPPVNPSSEDDRVNEPPWIGCWPASDATFPVGAHDGHQPATPPVAPSSEAICSADMS